MSLSASKNRERRLDLWTGIDITTCPTYRHQLLERTLLPADLLQDAHGVFIMTIMIRLVQQIMQRGRRS